jgi:hypothetical protein
MKSVFVIISLGLSALASPAQLQIVTQDPAPAFFSGGARRVRFTVHNPEARPIEATIRARILQTTSATAVRVSEVPWQRLQVLPGQTVVESATLTFPAVNAGTRFVVQWIEDTNQVIGKTDVMIYPTNLLHELKTLAGGAPLGIFDPNNELKPLLKSAAIDFADLADAGFEDFQGRLAVIGPFRTKAQMPEGLANKIGTLAKKGVAAVWIQPTPGARDPLRPSFYSVLENQIAVVMVQPEPVASLAENPQSQLNLIYFCELALHPRPLILPDGSPQP